MIAMLMSMVVTITAFAAEPSTEPQPPQVFTQEIAFEGTCPAVAPEFSTLSADNGQLLAQGCCKVCRKGKACGNSCISRNYTCHRPPGCACDG
ncbi:hypothetical protein EVC62_15950 [Salinicola endophyticus]|uniref:Uncharacterized protein n=1 Tax=Salinicola endophyticus TaxID=1949083 RepID=A0ABY8FJ85_9GAMM|nr:hypothetical protein [Salinicola endophyticus]WFF42868.1 hypothetical protein EVC62_15950 [Salinicola endophyticus]